MDGRMDYQILKWPHRLKKMVAIVLWQNGDENTQDVQKNNVPMKTSLMELWCGEWLTFYTVAF